MHLKELHVYVALNEGETCSRSDAAAARELFNCNPELNIVMVMSTTTETPNQFWRRGGETSYHLYDGKTKLLDFPPEV
tara:strand:- start:13 stop:246 length:234 start_codon:yes stop_codon:yes gene_type:complete